MISSMDSSHVSLMTWIEDVPEALLLMSPHGEIVHANLKARAILNLNLVGPVMIDDLFDMLATMGNLTRTLMRLVPGEEKQILMRYLKDPTRTFNMAIRRSAQHRYIVASIREELELIDAFEPMRSELESYQLLAQNLPNAAIVLFDRDMRYLIAEGVALEAAGFKPEHLLGKTLHEAFPDSVAHLEPIYTRALAGETHEAIVHASSGRIYESTVIPVKNKLDEVQGGMLFIMDISDSHQQANKLDMQERSMDIYAQHMKAIHGLLQAPNAPALSALSTLLDIPELAPQLARHTLDISSLIQELWQEIDTPDYVVYFLGKPAQVEPLYGDKHDLKALLRELLDYVISTLPTQRDTPLTLELYHESMLHMLTFTVSYRCPEAVHHTLPQTESALHLQLMGADAQVIKLLRLRHLVLSCSGILCATHNADRSSVVLTLQFSDARFE